MVVSRRDRITNADVHVPKSESEDPHRMFAVTPNRSCEVSDDPNDLSAAYQSQVLGARYHNQLPFEQIREAPITEAEMRQLVAGAPRRLEDLYPVGAARETYDMPVETRAAPATAPSRRAWESEVSRNRVPRTFEVGADVGGVSGTRAFQVGAGAEPLRGSDFLDASLRPQNREVVGADGYLSPALAPHSRGSESEREGARGYRRPMNDLSVCGGGRLGAATGAEGLAMVARDAARDTRKQWLVLHPREYGEFQSTATLPEKIAVRSDDLPRTTSRETLIHDTYEGVPTAPGPGRAGDRPEDRARKTVRETLPVGYEARNVNGVRREVAVVDIATLRATLGTTHREILDATTGVRLGAAHGKLSGGYGKFQDGVPVVTGATPRESTHVYRLMSAVSQRASEGVKALARWLISPTRGDQDARAWRAMAPHGPRMTPGVESTGDVRLNGRIEGHGRVFGNGQGSEAPAACPGTVSVRQNRIERDDDRLAVGAAGAASQFRANPYASPPLHALACA